MDKESIPAQLHVTLYWREVTWRSLSRARTVRSTWIVCVELQKYRDWTREAGRPKRLKESDAPNKGSSSSFTVKQQTPDDAISVQNVTDRLPVRCALLSTRRLHSLHPFASLISESLRKRSQNGAIGRKRRISPLPPVTGRAYQSKHLHMTTLRTVHNGERCADRVLKPQAPLLFQSEAAANHRHFWSYAKNLKKNTFERGCGGVRPGQKQAPCEPVHVPRTCSPGSRRHTSISPPWP